MHSVYMYKDILIAGTQMAKTSLTWAHQLACGKYAVSLRVSRVINLDTSLTHVKPSTETPAV